MKQFRLAYLAYAVILLTASLPCFAQVANQPFKGIWISPEFVLKINFYSKNIPDINSMNEDPCPGIIKVRETDKNHTSFYTIFSTKITGNKVNITVYDGEGNKVPVVLEYTPNGNMVFYPNDLTYLPKQEGLNKFSKPSYVLSKQGPFAGEWKTKNRSGKMEINLYDKVISGPDSVDFPLCYGIINITQGTRVDECIIIDCKTNNNQATIDYEDGRDGNTYRCTLVYTPANKQVSIKDIQMLKGDPDISDSYVVNGLVFVK